MSKEVAAAILTQVYFENVGNERSQLPGRGPNQSYAVGGLEQIGTIYGIFLARMDTFEQQGEDRAK